jgi:transposase
VAVVITQLTGVRHPAGHVWSILRGRLGWTLQRPERRAIERDEEAIARWVQHEVCASDELVAGFLAHTGLSLDHEPST